MSKIPYKAQDLVLTRETDLTIALYKIFARNLP